MQNTLRMHIVDRLLSRSCFPLCNGVFQVFNYLKTIFSWKLRKKFDKYLLLKLSESNKVELESKFGLPGY